jgi:hypothetical protein
MSNELSPRGRTCAARLTVLTIGCWTIAAAFGASSGARPSPVPDLVVWAWERPEDLRFLDPAVGVAVLDRTILLKPEGIDLRLRQHALRVRPGAHLIAVVRIEGDVADLSDVLRRRTVNVIADAAEGVRGLQIDFDAAVSQRRLYAALLEGVRAAIPRWMPLGVTALSSWCSDPDWLDSLPVNEAVPMLFRMGPDAGAVRRQVGRREPFAARRCRTSVGLSTDEPVALSRAGRRVYLFHPLAWSRSAFELAQDGLR